MKTKDFHITVLEPHEIERAAAFFNYDRAGYDDAALRKNMTAGDWVVFMAQAGAQDIAGFYLNFIPKYNLYQRLEIPEIQDLRVSSAHRRKGAATALIAAGEAMARERGHKGVGMSVGLYTDYGPAQRLYFKLGYEPDGQGVTYDRVVVPPGETRRIDDDLALMLLKFF